jgi:hypothetical protein
MLKANKQVNSPLALRRPSTTMTREVIPEITNNHPEDDAGAQLYQQLLHP